MGNKLISNENTGGDTMKLFTKTKTACPKCMLAKMWIQTNGKDVEIISIDEHEEIADKFRDLGIMAAPVLEVTDGEYITDIQKIEEALTS